MDAPEWVGNMPVGETLTRADAMNSLEQFLTIPPEKRPVPNTGQGWRRVRHEKIFPDRPLAEDGKPVVLPPNQ